MPIKRATAKAKSAYVFGQQRNQPKIPWQGYPSTNDQQIHVEAEPWPAEYAAIPSGIIATVQGHFGAPQFLFALCASMVVFRPEWKARIQGGPLSAVIGIAAILLVIGYMAAAGLSYR